MATFSFTTDRFPAGTTVGAYPVSGWLQSQLPASGAPQGAAVSTAVVSASSVLTFTGLADNARYYAVADVGGGTYRYVAFATAAASGAVVVAAPSGVVNGVSDTVAIQTAIDAAATAGGGLVQLRAGTYWTTGLTIKTGVRLTGEGYGATLVKLANNANTHVIRTLNFSTLTGTNTTGGEFNFAITDLKIDGNKINQSASAVHGLALYGYGFTLDRYIVQNCKGVGVWSEWGSSSLGTGDQMEASCGHFKIHNCGGVSGVAVQGGGTTSGTGIVWIGPHDSKILNGIMFYNGTATGGGAAVLDFPSASNANGSEVDHLHVWGNDPAGNGGGYDYGIRVGGSGITIGHGVEVESAAISGVHFTVGTNRCDARVYHVGTTYRAAGKGITLADGVSAIAGSVRIENCGGGAVDLGSGGGARKLSINAVYTSIAAPNPVIVGVKAATDHLDVLVTDSSGGPTTLNAESQILLPGAITGAARKQAFLPLYSAGWLVTGAKRENYPRLYAGNTELAPSATGTMLVIAGPYYFAGDVITAIALRSGSVAIATPTHQWFALIDQGLNVLRKTVDDPAGVWATFTTKTLALSSTYTVLADFQSYIGIVINAATAPTFRGINSALGLYSPILVGTSTTGLTDPASLGATAAALTASGGCVPYVYTT